MQVISGAVVRLFCLSLLTLSCMHRATASDPLFMDAAPLAITLSGPFVRINRERDKEVEYPGTLRFSDKDGNPVSLDAKFSVRGNFRLRKDVCSFAQLWVNLKKSQVKNTPFANQDKLKLVVQCKSGARYTEFLAREHQSYAIFSELSPLSLATRWVDVTYEDSENGKSRTHPAFFIEHQSRLASNHDMSVLKAANADKQRLDDEQSVLVALFMYLIANTDYSMIAALPGEGCCHNIKVLEGSAGKLYPVPYDFDSSGFVATNYAEPSAGIGQRNVRQRIYRGFCAPDAVTEGAIARMLDRREQINAIVGDERFIRARTVRKTRAYIDQFYAILNDPDKRQREVIDECR